MVLLKFHQFGSQKENSQEPSKTHNGAHTNERKSHPCNYILKHSASDFDYISQNQRKGGGQVSLHPQCHTASLPIAVTPKDRLHEGQQLMQNLRSSKDTFSQSVHTA